MLDYHGLAGGPAENQPAVASRHRITTRTLTSWSMTLTAAGRRLPLSNAVAAEAARRSRPGEDHLARTRIARTLEIAGGRSSGADHPPTGDHPLTTRSALTGRSGRGRDRHTSACHRRPTSDECAVRSGETVPPIRHPAASDRRPVALALIEAGATTDQGIWQALGGAIAPARDRALVAIVTGRDLTLQDMIDALVAAGYGATSARSRKISNHPLIRHVGPDRYPLLGEPPS